MGEKREPKQDAEEQLKEGTYGGFGTYIKVDGLGYQIQEALVKSFPEKDSIILDPTKASIEFEIIVDYRGTITRSSARINQTGEHGRNVNFIPSDKLCKLLIKYSESSL
jgi:hypothetical protein